MKLWQIILLLSITGELLGQKWQLDSFQVDFPVYSMSIDPLANRYLISDEMQILKYKPDGQFWNRYENNRLGYIGLLDVSNPFVVLVFYPQHQTLVLLDNNMAETGRINFSSIGLGNIRTAAISDDNNIWVFDEGKRKLVKINNAGRIVQEGIPYFGFDIDAGNPIFLRQRADYVYLSQAGKPVQVFDIFGKWVRPIDLGDFEALIYINNVIYYIDDDAIRDYNIETFGISKGSRWPVDGHTSVTYDPVLNRFYALSPERKIEYLVPEPQTAGE